MRKLEDTQGDDLSDRELLIVMLSFTDCAGRAEPLADALLARFHAFHTVFKADYNTLSQISGMTQNAICFILLISQTIRDARPRADAYYGARIGDISTLFAREIDGSPNEELWAAGFDEHGMLCACECIARGKADSVQSSISDIAGFCISRRIHDIALAHNHPVSSGGISAADRETADMIHDILLSFDIHLRWFVVLDEGADIITYEPDAPDLFSQ